MRTEFQLHDKKNSFDENLFDELKDKFNSEVANNLGMTWEMTYAEEKIPALILISKEDHCLNNIISKIDNINISIKGVISNHEIHEKTVEQKGIDFYYLPVNKKNKLSQKKY